jgi:hypothetical protein
MKNLTLIFNQLGYQQYVIADGTDGESGDTHVCPECETEYTNTGGGVICEKCGDGSLPNEQCATQGE